jgi:hypothetical protein
LQAEPEFHVFAATAVDQRTILVIEEEHPCQVRLRRSPGVPPVRGLFIISQELNRHAPQRRADHHTRDSESPDRYKIEPSATRPTSDRWTAVTPPEPARYRRCPFGCCSRAESFGGWTKTFTDPRLCAAIVDRLTFNGAIIETGTDSYRLAHTRAQQATPACPEHQDSCSFSLKAAGWFICPK